jgi:hypothetical protein
VGVGDFGGGDGGGDGGGAQMLTSGFVLRHWKAMVRSSVSRAVKVAAGFGVDIFGR